MMNTSCRSKTYVLRMFTLSILLSSVFQAANGAPPTEPARGPLAFDFETLTEAVISGGVPKDGIPSIDRPQFLSAEEASAIFKPDTVVFGVVINGEAKAYPQRVLVWHEIVNDQIAGQNISVTYCPLIGSSLGFFRGDTSFGVSGTLVNSNLVMYDHDTDSHWPQILGTAISGPLQGQVLQEFPVIWTTWSRWQAQHPETKVLSETTGFARNYHRDPYGGYTPIQDYYAEGGPLFPTLHQDPRLQPKTVVIGARTEHGAIAFRKEALRQKRISHEETQGERFTAVYNTELDTVHVYHNPEKLNFTFKDGAYTDGERRWAANQLPLEPVNAFDVMWFAWVAFYPETALYE